MKRSADPPSPTRRTGALRFVWIAGGLLATGLGGLGVIVPGLPSTVFFLIAAWCFARSSERLERWLLGLPGVGTIVRDARAGLGMPRRAKRSALAMMWIAIAISGVLLRDQLVVVGILLALGVAGTVCIVRMVPTRELVLAAQGGDGSHDIASS